MNNKITFIVITLTIFGNVIADQIDPNYDYNAFMIQFERNYTGDEKTRHEQIFNINYEDIKQRRINGQDVEVNNFTDWNQTQLDNFFNYNPSQFGVQTQPPALRSSGLSVSPSAHDWRALGRVTDVKDQKQCGSCWSFAATAQAQSIIAIATNGTKYDLAEQYALQCETTSSGCRGGTPLNALKLINKTGIPLQSAYPYMQSSTYYTNSGKKICNETNMVKLGVPVTKISYYSNLTIQQIQTQLISFGPLSVGIFASHNGFIYTGKSGKINCPTTSSSIDHAVLLVGYNSTHWIIKNSWATSWGDGGYGYIDKTNDCGLNTYVNTVQVSYSSAPANNSTNNNTNNNTNNSTNNNTSTNVTIVISLTDSKGNGWNGNVLALKQGTTNIALIGYTFTSGSTFPSYNISINGTIQTSLVVFKKGSMTSQMGFSLKFTNGTVIYQRTPGQIFGSETIFKIFCPLPGCKMGSTIDYYLTMFDSWGDGWNDNVLAFRQNGTTSTFGQQMNYVRTVGPIKVTFKRFVKVQVIVNKMGSWTEQVGFQVRTYDGRLVSQRKPGNIFYANNILATFCPDCVNLSPVQIMSDSQTEQQMDNESQQISEQQQYKLATFILAGLSALMGLAIVGLGCRLYRIQSLNKNKIENMHKIEEKSIDTCEKSVNKMQPSYEFVSN